mmetsp:Transcript_30680/g.67193  ORF Transcript_30680/g.67193 Transcript_30680/m.67193 type:complete len:510 (+) Transcript_30680:1-1530(+)
MQQAQQAMSNLSPEELRARMNSVGGAGGAPGGVPALPTAARPTAAASASVVSKLRASAMSVPEDVLELVEEAETQKASGNKRFKEGEFARAIAAYRQGAKLLQSVLDKKRVSGVDKTSVLELMDALQLNSSNCRLKLEEWPAAVEACSEVLARGDNRKAFFQRGKAHVQLGKLQEAHDDLQRAVAMEPSDSVVRALLNDVEAKLGKPATPPPATRPATTPASRPATTPAAPLANVVGSPPAVPQAGAPPGMPTKPDGTPDYEAMEKMIGDISPEQLKQQAAMLENLSPEQLRSMAPQLGGMDPTQLKAISSMMANMDPNTMKNMAKMASQMGVNGAAPRMPPTAGAGPSALATGVNGTSSPLGGGTPAGMPAGMPAGTPAGAPAGMPGGPPKSIAEGLDMMSNMSPEMMQAGVDMMKSMDPKMMAEMSKSMLGREMSEAEIEKMQSMMSGMKPEDMQKWAGRAQTVAKVAAKPAAVYNKVKQYVSANTVFALLVLLCAILFVGHLTDAF